jgi:hypothetical protein
MAEAEYDDLVRTVLIGHDDEVLDLPARGGILAEILDVLVVDLYDRRTWMFWKAASVT